MRRPLVALTVLLASAAARGDGLAGTYALKGGGVTVTLVLEESRGRVTGTLTSSNGTSLALEGAIEDGTAVGTCTGAGGQSMFEAELEGGKLVLTLVELGAGGTPNARSLEFVRSSGAPRGADSRRVPEQPQAAPEPRPERRPAGEPGGAGGDGDLVRYFAGEYYSFTSGGTMYGSSGTERTLTLCPDGSYRDSYESGAYGGGWGSAAQRAGAGRWSMQGDRQRGVLRLVSPGGAVRQVQYQVVRKGTFLLDGVTFAYSGEPKCR
jgi:hypothetical protein